jgi:hypothetical protein
LRKASPVQHCRASKSVNKTTLISFFVARASR